MKKFISDGGQTSCDLSSKSFDKSILEPNKRKKENAVIDNFLTKNIDNLAVLRRKSKDKSREKLNRENKENRCSNIPTVFSSINTESKKIKNSSKSKIN